MLKAKLVGYTDGVATGERSQNDYEVFALSLWKSWGDCRRNNWGEVGRGYQEIGFGNVQFKMPKDT